LNGYTNSSKRGREPEQQPEEEKEEGWWPKPQQQVPPVEVAYTMLDMHSSNQKVINGASSTYVLTFVLLERGSKNAKIF
jgi:hypothetical protein